jgi:hypothetical protein
MLHLYRSGSAAIIVNLANWAGSIDGVVDEVRLYDRALEPDEVKDAMESAEGKAVTLAGKLSTTWGEAKRAL